MPGSASADRTMAHRITVRLEYDGLRRARVVERSLTPEIDEIDDDRSTAGLARQGRTVELSIEAADLVALRAAANSWLSLSSVAERVLAAVDGGGPENR